MNAPENLISTKELAWLLGISPVTVRHYTNMELFKARGRKGNAKLYEKREALWAFEKIYRLKKEGHRLGLIKEKLTIGCGELGAENAQSGNRQG